MLKKNLNNNKQEKIGLIYFHKFIQLMIKSTITQQAPSPRPSSTLLERKIRTSGLDMAHIQFAITPKDKYQDQ